MSILKIIIISFVLLSSLYGNKKELSLQLKWKH